MILSLGETGALCRKAARGAGMDWGSADEAGSAVRRLATFALPGPESLLSLLVARDGRPTRELLPQSLDAGWRSDAGALCPILAGAALADRAAWFGETGEIMLHDVLSPLLAVPFANLVAQQLGQSVSVAWDDVTAIDDGNTLRLTGTQARWLDKRAAIVRCRTGTAVSGAASDPLARVSRVRLDPACFERLDTFARRTYAPATEESRLRGAGGAQADND